MVLAKMGTESPQTLYFHQLKLEECRCQPSTWESLSGLSADAHRPTSPEGTVVHRIATLLFVLSFTGRAPEESSNLTLPSDVEGEGGGEGGKLAIEKRKTQKHILAKYALHKLTSPRTWGKTAPHHHFPSKKVENEKLLWQEA